MPILTVENPRPQRPGRSTWLATLLALPAITLALFLVPLVRPIGMNGELAAGPYSIAGFSGPYNSPLVPEKDVALFCQFAPQGVHYRRAGISSIPPRGSQIWSLRIGKLVWVIAR